MEKIKKTLLEEYGIGEYILALLGLVILFKVGEWFWITEFDDYSWETITFVILAMAFGAILTGAPLSMLEWARKKIGVPTRKEKLK